MAAACAKLKSGTRCLYAIMLLGAGARWHSWRCRPFRVHAYDLHVCCKERHAWSRGACSLEHMQEDERGQSKTTSYLADADLMHTS